MNTRKIAKDFGLKVVHVNSKNIDRCSKKYDIRKADFVNNGFMYYETGDVILGIYEDRDLKNAAFFHEIGHTIVKESFEKMVYNDEMLIEFQAWVEGLKIAKKYKHEIKPKVFKYILKSINSYYKSSLQAYNKRTHEKS